MANRDEQDPQDIKVSDRRAFGGLTVDEILAGKIPPERPAEPAAAPEPPKAAPAGAPRATPPPPPPTPARSAEDEAAKKKRFGLFGRKEREQGPRPQGAAPGGAPTITFVGFITSLAHSALIGLGEEADPFTGESRPNLAAAKQTIDLLALLADKTQGNLSADEDGLFQAILTDLRLRYVDATRRGG